MDERQADIVIIGGGIAGASVGYELAETHNVVLLERETVAGLHSTGRSAALFNGVGGAPEVRQLTLASLPFLARPPDGFTDHPLITPRGLIFVARDNQMAELNRMAATSGTGSDRTGGAIRLSPEEVERQIPVFRPGYLAGALADPKASDIDVHGLHQGYLRGLRRRGGDVLTGLEAVDLAYEYNRWRIRTPETLFSAPIVVNAAGAWADEIALRAGVRQVGLNALRRTIFTFRPQVPGGFESWPCVIDADEAFYFKPDSDVVIGSPADETPVGPCDPSPQPLDIAHGVDRIEKATTLRIERIVNKWAGLRTFAPDRLPVVGFTRDADGFFWLAGQGGFGIRTAPAVAEMAASIIRRDRDPDPALSPNRFFSGFP